MTTTPPPPEPPFGGDAGVPGGVPQYTGGPAQPGAMPSYQEYGGTPYGGYGAPPMIPKNGMGTASLVLGILSLLIGGIFLAIPAIVMGRIGMNRAARGEATNSGQAKAGFILGIIGTAISVIAIVVLASN